MLNLHGVWAREVGVSLGKEQFPSQIQASFTNPVSLKTLWEDPAIVFSTMGCWKDLQCQLRQGLRQHGKMAVGTKAATSTGICCAVAELAGTPRCVCTNDVPKLEEEDFTAYFL